MDINKNDNEQEKPQWWSKVTLKDWAIIVGIFLGAGGIWVNLAAANAMSESQMRVIAKELSDVNTILKEMQQKQENNYNKLDVRITDNMVGLEVVKNRIENIERLMNSK